MQFADLLHEVNDQHLRFIASLDYGKDADRHFSALKQVLSEQDALINGDQLWHPYEVIELGALWLQSGHEVEFALCNCIVARNVAAGLDRATQVSWRIETHAEQLDALSPVYRDLVLAEFVRADQSDR